MDIDDEAARRRLLEVFRSLRSGLPALAAVRDEDGELQLLHAVVLQVLDRGGEPTIKELAAVVKRSVSQTSRLVDQLVRRGLVERYEDKADRRMRRVRVTGRGVASLRRMDQMRVEAQLRLWDHLGPEERPVVLQAMELLAKAAERMRHDDR
jgi:DNA-binding MarR family transcriptional regulator